MEKKTFELLQEASKNPVNQSNYKSDVSNRDQRIEDGEKQERLKYLLNQGLVSHTKDIYIITEYGYHVAQFKSWDDYLTHQKSLIDKKIKKENADLKISEFQSRTKLLPYFLSFISIVISVIAIFDPFKSDQNTLQKKVTPEKSIIKDTISHTKKADLDTVKPFHIDDKKN